jgi:hypothetical protein
MKQKRKTTGGSDVCSGNAAAAMANKIYQNPKGGNENRKTALCAR